MTVTVEYVQKTNAVDTFNTDEMAAEFLRQFTRQSFTKDQMVLYSIQIYNQMMANNYSFFSFSVFSNFKTKDF